MTCGCQAAIGRLPISYRWKMQEKMTDSGSNSFDNVKLIVAALIFLAVCATLVGIVPVAILLAGLLIAMKGGDIKNITTTTRFVQTCLLLIGVALIVFGFIGYESYSNDRFLPFTLAIALLFLSALLEAIWLDPLVRKFSGAKAACNKLAHDMKLSDSASSIIRRDALTSYSVADELGKWHKLLLEGAITQAEYDGARATILRK